LSSDRWTSHTVAAAEAGRTVQEILTGGLGISRRMIQKLTRSGGIRLNRRPAFLGRKVREGDVVAARLAQPEEPGLQAVPMDLAIVYEDEHLLVVDKPAGMLVHPVGREGEVTLAHGVTHHFQEKAVRAKVRPVHRLDRDTTGLVLIARSAFVHQALDRQLRAHEVRRTYLAFTCGAPSPAEGVVDAPIGPHPRHPHLRAVGGPGDSPAVTRFRTLERLEGAALLEVELETGRTHQIRVHFAHLGHPLLGDVQYGAPARSDLHRQALHAARLSFDHPVSHRLIELESPLPADLEELRRRLRPAGGAAEQPDGESAAS
jgi:23S rRNA pseudouridine1911/1915/1917 synthase